MLGLCKINRVLTVRTGSNELPDLARREREIFRKLQLLLDGAVGGIALIANHGREKPAASLLNKALRVVMVPM